ncbi:MAG: ABC transporter ATP-binding protein/permease [Clostridiales bacterium]|jgi:ABC-type multidrug transport system fused ATPase/permease subunit|nr:ABC transporter ATP-binding protein/permease [Clostridiales bacterium]
MYSFVFALSQVIDALIPTFTIFVTAAFINAAIEVFNKEATMNDLVLPIAMIFAITAYSVLSGAVMKLIDTSRVIYFRKTLVPEMIKFRASLEYRHIEDQKTHDLIWRVFPYIENTVWNMFTQVVEAVSLIIFVLGITGTLFTQMWWLAVVMVAAGVPIIYFAAKAGRASYNADRDMTEIDRKQWNLSWILIDRENVEERTVYGYGTDVNDEYVDKFEFARKYRLKINAKNFAKQKMVALLSIVCTIAAILALIPRVFAGEMSVGMFIGLVNAVIALSDRLAWGVNDMVVGITKSREWLKDLTDFMKLETIEGATDEPAKNFSFREIEFINVSFKYPKTEKLVLDGVNFTIKKGMHYSFVGENGAGKTTITKLLTGLYDNYTGEILVDGKNLREFSHAQLKSLTAVVYQDYARYRISLYDNIAMGNIADFDNREKVEEAVKLVGLEETVSNLKDGLDTPLGKVLAGGVDLSGGQWQRTAMARCVINPAPLKILDEPTAALDPVAESTIYRNFETITRGQTTIFISHRLGSTKLADIIYVLDKGKIIESGSHSELMSCDGVYRRMFNVQAKWYAAEASDE